MIKEYPEILANDPVYGPRAKEAANKIYEFTQFIYRVLGTGSSASLTAGPNSMPK